ncbi:hypothetical protein JCM3774_004229 [Rhodotorula dairenensis]
MTRSALLALVLAFVIASTEVLGLTGPRSRGFALERRSPKQGGAQQQNLEARSQYGNATASYTSATSALMDTLTNTSLSDRARASAVYTAATKTTTPANSVSGPDWASATNSYTSHDAESFRSSPSSYACSAASTASPAPSHAAPTAEPVIDVVVLQLAVVLEALEGAFYREGLKRFGLVEMMDAGLSRLHALIIIEQIQIIIVDEQNHFDALSGALVALGAQVPTNCGFDFSKSMPDPLTFLSTARSIEAVGVSAYLGAAHLLQSADLLEAAASILTLEARHQSLLNVLSGGSYNPQSFDIQLPPQAVLALVGGFLTGCQAKDLGLTANQPLSVRSSDHSDVYGTGSQLVFEVVDVSVQIETLFCQMIIGGSPVAIVAPATACYVPSGLDGPVAVYLTSNDTPLATDVVIQNQLTIVAGPGLIFIDEQITILAVLLGPSAGGANGNRTLPCADLGGWAVEAMRAELGFSSPTTTHAALTTTVSSATGATYISSYSSLAGSSASSSPSAWATSSVTSSPTYRLIRRQRGRSSH